MATYAKSTTTKSKFIMSAYRHLESQDDPTLTVRALAAENGYSVAALYKHFESLEYLLVVASIKFIGEYLSEYARLLDGSKSPLQIYAEGWDVFIECAFGRPDIFHRIFWEIEQEDLEHAFIDYYRVFPPEDPELNAVQFSVLITNDDLRGRDRTLLGPLVKCGELDAEGLKFLSMSTELIVSGLLKRAIGASEEERDSLKRHCRELVSRNISQCTECARGSSE